MKEKKEVKISLTTLIFIILLIVILAGIIIYGGFYMFTNNLLPDNDVKPEEVVVQNKVEETETKKDVNIVTNDDNNKDKLSITSFELAILKEENDKTNNVHSPLSIKYALKMLEEGATGTTKEQIKTLVGTKELPKYKVSENMSLANALFVRDTFGDYIKEEYKNTLEEKYDAEVIVDTFKSAESVNLWVKNKTLNIIDNLLDEIDPRTNFMLVNALAIDMEWENKFFHPEGEEFVSICYMPHLKYGWYSDYYLLERTFDKNQQVSTMEVIATIDKYDIVNEIGKDNIIKTVSDAFKAWAAGDNTHSGMSFADMYNVENPTDEFVEEKLQTYLYGDIVNGYEVTGYLDDIDSNYKQVKSTTDFEYFVDDNVKVFAKDLKEYDGTTLKYIGIMPKEENLDTYIENVTANEINEYISSLKGINLEDSKDNVITEIYGTIPKFKFDKEINLLDDLKSLGVTDVFDKEKANLDNLSDAENVYINDAVHKADIDFNQDGIKAAAATFLGGAGAGDPFDYLYEVPVEKIDITFDKPYIFLVVDKETSDVWFTGAVYEPLKWEDDTTRAPYDM